GGPQRVRRVGAGGSRAGRIEVLDAVGCAADADAVRAAEAVQLDQELVQSLVVLAVETAAGAPGADGVELVNEDDRGRVLAGLLEELADAGRPQPGERLQEVC